jgi:hypothetical protein
MTDLSDTCCVFLMQLPAAIDPEEDNFWEAEVSMVGTTCTIWIAKHSENRRSTDG